MTQYYCPRCKNKSIIEYDEIIECPKCKLSFYKDMIKMIDDDSAILSIEELNDITVDKKTGKIKDIFKNI